MARNVCGTEESKYTTVQSHGSHDMNFPNIIGEQVVDKIVERVVDKINKEVKPDVRMKVISEGDTLPNPGGISQKIRVCDVEHIAQLQEFVSAPAQLCRPGSLTDSEIKMDIDQEQSDMEGYSVDEVKTKECIVFRNQIYSLSLLLSRRLKSGKDLQNLEDTLYSLDRTFTRGVSRDVESFFNSIVLMVGHHQNSMAARYDITLHIAENARQMYLVNIFYVIIKSVINKV